MRIRTIGDDVLEKKARPVKHVNRSIRSLMDRMLATMYSAEGIGLAAPQVGVGKRVIVVDIGEGPIFLANPEILRAEGTEAGNEGCLSVPGKAGVVERYKSITVTGLDKDGHKVWIDATDLLARVFQHEIDHLDGVLFIEKATKVWDVPPETTLRIVFMGTPEFAVPILAGLLNRGCHVVAVVTQPDRPRGRGHAVRPSPVKGFALDNGIRVMEPTRLRDPEFLKEMADLRPDVIVTAAYGRLIPRELLDLPPMGCYNVHPSLLPAYRGAAPIHHALLRGDTRTGISIFRMTEELDAGDIIVQEETEIRPDEDRGSLEKRLAERSSEVLLKALRLVATGEAIPVAQDASKATYAPMISSADEAIDWQKDARTVVSQIRALAPAPGATTRLAGQPLKVLAASVWEGQAGDGLNPDAAPGTVLAIVPREGFVVACGGGAVLVRQVKPAGRRAMQAADFLNGSPLQPGDRLI